MKPRIYYKFFRTKEGKRHKLISPWGRMVKWSLPKVRKDGVTPGDWVKVEGKLMWCQSGLHAWRDVGHARWQILNRFCLYPLTDFRLFEVQVRGKVLGDQFDTKVCARSMRLIREIPVTITSNPRF
jgi:hypothetical protein